MRTAFRSSVIALLAAAVAGCDAGRTPLASCPDTASAAVDRAWEAYRARDHTAGARAARGALRLCPEHVGGLTVMGYHQLQRGRLERAAARFDAVLSRDSLVVDAAMGRGLVAWRQADPATAHRMFSRVTAVEPDNETARSYLSRIPAGYATVRRPPLVVPDSVAYPARARAGRLEVRTGDGWRPFHVNGMNLGAALPGRHPSQFPDSAVYAGWIAEMAAMNVNAVRVYTIHPPWFYEALAAHNLAHPDRPLWLIHGVWTELPPGHDFRDDDWYGAFKAEMERVVDLLHGRADIAPRPGHASGHYTADVSDWTLAYIIGREWEPFAVEAYNEMREKRDDETSYDGTYLTARNATPTDVWMADALEHLVAYEMARYNAQRPVAYTNWPTLDPLDHPTEATVEEEVEIREALGERIDRVPVEYDNDAAALDATLIQATDRLPAGTFASFHAYPYYPDFMILDPGYAAATSPWGPSNYFGYLTDLAEHHGDMPVMISEYGVPTGRGSAHMQPQGWHHGGLTEPEMAAIDARMTREIAAAGLAGGAVFAWIDEWFKHNWLVIEFELPADRNRMWLNRLDAEQHYGMLAIEPEPRVPGRTDAERLAGWREVPPLYDGGGATGNAAAPGTGAAPGTDATAWAGATASAGAATSTDAATGTGPGAGPTRIRAVADEAYLRLLIDGPGARAGATTLVGFDVVDPAAGELRWPSTVSPAEPPPDPAVGLEFALVIDGTGLQLVAHDRYAPWRVQEVGAELAGAPRPPPEITDPMPGFFSGRLEQRRNRPYRPAADSGGEYWGIPVVTNRRRYTRDSVEIAAYGYHRGILRAGPEPDGDWSRLAPDALEVRIPWGLLNVTDPSSRSVLYEERGFLGRLPDPFGTVTVEGLRVVAAVRAVGAGPWRGFPTSGRAEDAALVSWPTWDEPRWRARRRPVFDSLRTVFAELERQGGP